MAILSFPMDQVTLLAEHAKSQTSHSPTLDQMFDREFFKDGVGEMSDIEIFQNKCEHIDMTKIPVGLHLVKDGGIYLMSNAKENLHKDPKDHSQGSIVCYAKGYNPDMDEDVYDKCERAMGGDDVVEFLPIEWYEAAKEAGVKAFKLKVTKKTTSLIL